MKLKELKYQAGKIFTSMKVILLLEKHFMVDDDITIQVVPAGESRYEYLNKRVVISALQLDGILCRAPSQYHKNIIQFTILHELVHVMQLSTAAIYSRDITALENEANEMALVILKKYRLCEPEFVSYMGGSY